MEVPLYLYHTAIVMPMTRVAQIIRSAIGNTIATLASFLHIGIRSISV